MLEAVSLDELGFQSLVVRESEAVATVGQETNLRKKSSLKPWTCRTAVGQWRAFTSPNQFQQKQSMWYHAKGTRILTQTQFFSSDSSLKDNPPVWVRGWLVLVARCSLRYKRSYLGPRRHSPKSFTSWLVLITSTTTHIHLNITYTRTNCLIAASFNDLCLYQTVLHGKLNLKAVTFFPLDCLRSLKKSCNAYQNM